MKVNLSEPEVTFFVGEPAQPIGPESPQWLEPLPVDRNELKRHRADTKHEAALRYKEYFTCAKEFLARNQWEIVLHAAGHALKKQFRIRQIKAVHIHLIKHGAFYHPAKVTAQISHETVALCLNIAVSGAGLELYKAEASNLVRLAANYPAQVYVPIVLSNPESVGAGAGQTAMFAVQWLSGYREFHATRRFGQGLQWVVWDTDSGHWRLDQSRVYEIYRQAAFILTYYYQPCSFECVLNWHHAAGDFVVRSNGGSLDVRLITVRNYQPMLTHASREQPGLEDVLEGFLIFFIGLSIKMRLDRLDGAGDVIWMPGWIADAVWQGFMEGVDHVLAVHQLPAEFKEGLRQYMSIHSYDEILNLGQRIIQRYSAESEDTALVHLNLSGHADKLAGIVSADR
ncbi:MAG: hypothetical protein GY874_19665 [Desulfobacteraceae bacterium]|nr:hypothetical protein [Desulfobacteraceae bacterium]